MQNPQPHLNRTPAPLIGIAAKPRRIGHYDRAGGMDYLTALLGSCPGAANIAAYTREILECSRLRHQMEMGEMIRAVALRGAHPDQIANAIKNCIDRLETRGYADLKTIFEECK